MHSWAHDGAWRGWITWGPWTGLPVDKTLPYHWIAARRASRPVPNKEPPPVDDGPAFACPLAPAATRRPHCAVCVGEGSADSSIWTALGRLLHRSWDDAAARPRARHCYAWPPWSPRTHGPSRHGSDAFAHGLRAMERTLDVVLGNLGGKRKSWMTAPANPPSAEAATRPPPAPTRRPRSRPKQTPRPSQPARPPGQPQADRLPPSNSTSPQLANAITQPGRASHAASIITVLPSPTPSDDNMAGTSPETALNASPRARHATEEAGEAHAHHADKRRRLDSPGQDQPTTTATTTGQPPLPRPEKPQPSIPPVETPSVGQMPSPQVPQRLPVRDAHSTRSSSTWYTAQECLKMLDRFVASYTTLSRHPRDRTRLSLLKHAIERQDWPYLTLHQYYCLLTTNPTAVPAHLQPRLCSDITLRVLQQVLGPNHNLSAVVLDYFSNFPYPVESLRAMWPSQFQRQDRLFYLFVSSLPIYDQLKPFCEKRGVPPLVSELVDVLRIASTTFQRYLFITTLRAIWHRPPQTTLGVSFEAEALWIFDQNQADYYQRHTFTADIQTLNPRHDQQEKDLEWNMWGTRLRRMLLSFEQTLHSQGSPTANQHSPTLQQQPQHHRAQTSPGLPARPINTTPRSVHPMDPHQAQAAVRQQRGQNRRHNEPAPAPHVLPSQLISQQRTAAAQPPQSQGLLLPPAWRTLPQPREPNPVRSSLHQAHLQCPILQAHSVTSPLYHFIVKWARSPTRLSDAGRRIEKLTFILTPDEIQALPKLTPSPPGAPDTRLVGLNSKTYRVRCIKWEGAQMPREHAWVVADTAWIPYSSFSFNGTSLEQRKKIHNGKDLPIDITSLMREGENVLEVAVLARPNDRTHLNYFVAVEVLDIQDHDSIKQQCLDKNRISAAQVLQGIKTKLSGTVLDDDDDEIAIVQSSLTINLFDPFSASKMCDIPVRSKVCLHNDCFDLETFLQTRPRKGDVSVPDRWRCPICNADARPHLLLVDGFLEDVRKTLEAQGLQQTRAILVQQDGTWAPKAEVRDPKGVSDSG